MKQFVNEGILVNKKIIKKEIDLENNNSNNYLILFFPDSILKELKNKKIGKERYEYFLKNKNFITNKYYLFYDEKNNKCVIDYIDNLKSILEVLKDYLNDSTYIFLKCDKKYNLEKILSCGFSEPFINKGKLYFSKINNNWTSADFSFVKNKIENLFNIEKEKTCYSYYKFSKKILDFFKLCIKSGYHLENGKLVKDCNKKHL
jgi:hypothetical protein